MGSDNQALLYEKPANKMDGDSSSRGRLQAGASSAATRTRASSSMAVPLSTSSEGFPARPQSACSMRPPTPQGLAMIKTTEKTPPPTNMTFEEALATLHQLEKQLTIEVQKAFNFEIDFSIRITSRKTIHAVHQISHPEH